MAQEIERKFLIKRAEWNRQQKGEGVFYQQGYLLTDPDKTIRVRVAGDKGYLTIKGKTKGIARPEYEYAIPKQEALELLAAFTNSVITKYRYRVLYEGKVWEVDEFLEANEGLILAEIELAYEGETFALPGWIDKEVSDDKRYYNAYLSLHPFNSW